MYNPNQKIRVRNLEDLPRWLKAVFPEYEFSAWYWYYGIDVTMFVGEDIINQWSFADTSQSAIFVKLKDEIRKSI